MTKVSKLDFLISFYIFCILVAELMGSKTFPLPRIANLQLNASVAIFVLPILFTINDVITEVYGPERTRSVVRSGLVMIFFTLLFSLLATSLPPSARFSALEASYDQVFHVAARISAASLTAFAVAEFLDVAVFSKLKKKLGKKALWLRNNLSNFIAQFFDTSLFMFLAFYDPGKPFSANWPFLVSLILPYWLLKCGASIIETPLVYLGVKWLRAETQPAQSLAVKMPKE